MTKEIVISVISSAAGALIAFLATAAFGLYEKELKDDAVEKVASTLVTTEEYRNVLLRRMEESGKFQGKKGDKGDQGQRGPQGLKGDPGQSMTFGESRRLVLDQWHTAESDGFVMVGVGGSGGSKGNAWVNSTPNKNGTSNRAVVEGWTSQLLLVRRGQVFRAEKTGGSGGVGLHWFPIVSE